jgi:hypothetical protein
MIDKIFKSNTFVTKSILVENNVNSTNNYELTKLEINEIENEIYNTINIKVEIFSTLIKRNEKNVILQGEIVDFRVKFMFILNENNGVYIRIPEAIKLDDLLLSTIKQLRNYYFSWKDTWNSNKINLYL